MVEIKEAESMKEGIHPDYDAITITCACGEVIHTRSTKPSYKVDICSKCHPFFTGKQKLIDAAGRVDRFRKKYGQKDAATA
jgi:large subunit ribosomal protein L31